MKIQKRQVRQGDNINIQSVTLKVIVMLTFYEEWYSEYAV